jgi:hypothetical protein
MGSSHHSRGRILFEVLCALSVSASLAGAWVQTGASALLPAAVVALLYALIHLFDLSGQPAIVDAQPVTEPDVQAEPVEAAAPQADDVPRLKAPKNGASRRAKSPKAKASRPAASERSVVAEAAPAEESMAAEITPSDEIDTVVPISAEELVHAPVTQLFEPEPFAHQQRTVFGRKAG